MILEERSRTSTKTQKKLFSAETSPNRKEHDGSIPLAADDGREEHLSVLGKLQQTQDISNQDYIVKKCDMIFDRYTVVPFVILVDKISL